MKLKYKSSNIGINNSFYFSRENVPCHDGNWHYHKEYELIYIMSGEGIRIVGDSLSNFLPPQLALVGSWLPHLWKNVESEKGEVDIVIIKFDNTFNGQNIFDIPEFSQITELLKFSKRGLLFGRDTIDKIHHLLLSLSDSEGADRMISLIQVLNILSHTENYNILTFSDFSLPASIEGGNRLSRIINYISDNYYQQVSIEDIAENAAMTPSSLCRFFKNRTNKTVFQFINEFRIGKACQMLISGNQTITDICYASGFNSLSSFNRVFKDLKKTTPSNYKQKFQKINS